MTPKGFDAQSSIEFFPRDRHAHGTPRRFDCEPELCRRRRFECDDVLDVAVHEMKRTVPTIQALVFCDVLQLSESVLSRAREQRRLLGRTWRRERQREGVNAASRVLSRCSELVLGYEHQSIFMAPESAPCSFFHRPYPSVYKSKSQPRTSTRSPWIARTLFQPPVVAHRRRKSDQIHIHYHHLQP